MGKVISIRINSLTHLVGRFKKELETLSIEDEARKTNSHGVYGAFDTHRNRTKRLVIVIMLL